jgi:DNA-binding transcriptional ArsR family regulator
MKPRPDLDAAFTALADPTRRAVIALLMQRPRRSSDIAASLSATRPAMSRHLRILRRAKLVEEAPLDEDARVRMYRLRPHRFADIRRWLEEIEAMWSGQLDAFRQHVARRTGRKER